MVVRGGAAVARAGMDACDRARAHKADGGADLDFGVVGGVAEANGDVVD